MPTVSVPTHVAGLPGVCVRNLVCRSGFPLVSPLPPLPPQTVAHHRPCSEASSVLWNCLTSHVRSSLPYSLRILSAGLWFITSRPNMGPPGSRAKSLRTCSGSLTTQGPIVSRDNDTTSVAFRFSGQRRHPKVYNIFRGSIALPVRPLSTLRPYPYGYTRMTRGRCGSLLLHRLELPSITLCRFSGATHYILTFDTIWGLMYV